jgi:hypothetical protein
MTAPDLQAAATVVDLAQQVVGTGVHHLSATGGRTPPAARLRPGPRGRGRRDGALDARYGALGDDEAPYVRVRGRRSARPGRRVLGREALWDVAADSLDAARAS